MKKFLLVSIIVAFLISPAHASVFYVNSGETSADLCLISKDSSGNLTSSVIRSDLAADSKVFSFKHNGEERILISERNSDRTENVISIYNLSDLTTPLASKDIFSADLTRVTSVAELKGNLILAGDGNTTTGKGAILEINPDTCEIVGSYALNLGYAVGSYFLYDIAPEVVVNNEKIYAKIDMISMTSAINKKYVLVEADSLSSFSDALNAEAVSNDLHSSYSYELRSINNNLYMNISDYDFMNISDYDFMNVSDNDNYGLYKLNSLSFNQAEKVIDAFIMDFDSDGNNGLYYAVRENNSSSVSLYHWDGSASSKIYDKVFEFPEGEYAFFGSVVYMKYDKYADILCVRRITFSEPEANLLVLKTDGTLLKGSSVGTITSFAVVESSSSNAVDPETETGTKTETQTETEGNKTTSTTLGRSSGGCNAGLTSLCLLLAFAFFKKH